MPHTTPNAPAHRGGPMPEGATPPAVPSGAIRADEATERPSLLERAIAHAIAEPPLFRVTDDDGDLLAVHDTGHEVSVTARAAAGDRAIVNVGLEHGEARDLVAALGAALAPTHDGEHDGVLVWDGPIGVTVDATSARFAEVNLTVGAAPVLVGNPRRLALQLLAADAHMREALGGAR